MQKRFTTKTTEPAVEYMRRTPLGQEKDYVRDKIGTAGCLFLDIVLCYHATEVNLMSEEILIQRSAEILGGTPVFAGTRVPVQTLIAYLEEGDTLDEFLDDFPAVSRNHAVKVLEKMKESLLAQEYESAA
jgi:uncharacterized protein (DUF433 family)